MTTFYLPSTLRPLAGGADQLEAAGATVRHALPHPELSPPPLARCVPGQPARPRPPGAPCVAAGTGGTLAPALLSSPARAAPAGAWEQAAGPAFPAAGGAAVERIWAVEPGSEDGVLWAGVAPAALFRSDDGGRSWE